MPCMYMYRLYFSFFQLGEHKSGGFASFILTYIKLGLKSGHRGTGHFSRMHANSLILHSLKAYSVPVNYYGLMCGQWL